jgi:hypothetical protein
MSALAMKLDQRLLSLPPDQSAALEKQVQKLLDAPNPLWPDETNFTATGWPKGWLRKIAEDWGSEPFEAPPELPTEKLESW